MQEQKQGFFEFSGREELKQVPASIFLDYKTAT